MAQVQTTAGPVDAEKLGKTLVHEHCQMRSEWALHNFPHLYDEAEEEEVAVAEVERTKTHGVETICDPSVMGHGRNIELFARVAQRTGVNLVVATGAYTYDFLPPHFQNRDEDYLASLFVHDIEEGIQKTAIKAAFLKCACDEQGMTPDVEKIHRAVARAHKQTGAPIMAHSHPASQTGLKQMDVFDEEGVDPARVQIAHTGDTTDLDYIEALLARGPFIGMDRYGLDIILPSDQRNATVLELLERGHGERMHLSQDACPNFDWFPAELRAQLAPQWTMTFIFEEILPALAEGGASTEQLDAMIGENVRKWLA